MVNYKNGEEKRLGSELLAKRKYIKRRRVTLPTHYEELEISPDVTAPTYADALKKTFDFTYLCRCGSIFDIVLEHAPVTKRHFRCPKCRLVYSISKMGISPEKDQSISPDFSSRTAHTVFPVNYYGEKASRYDAKNMKYSFDASAHPNEDEMGDVYISNIIRQIKTNTIHQSQFTCQFKSNTNLTRFAQVYRIKGFDWGYSGTAVDDKTIPYRKTLSRGSIVRYDSEFCVVCDSNNSEYKIRNLKTGKYCYVGRELLMYLGKVSERMTSYIEKHKYPAIIEYDNYEISSALL